MLQIKFYRRWSCAFNLTVANSEATKRYLMAESIEPVEVVWSGVPTQEPRLPPSSPPTVAFAGRLVREKGADVLVRAFDKVVRQIPDARLLLAGDGPESERVKRLIADLGLSSSVSMLGHLPQPEVECRTAVAWVQAIPSLWAEPFGLVAAEAMMRGTAVVASASGGLAEIVRDGKTGFLVPPGDAEALTEALIHLLQDRELAEQMGRAGRKIALAHFSESTYVNRFLQGYSYEDQCAGF
jgi:glycosyltransferase involved in cell wall biosynthesis